MVHPGGRVSDADLLNGFLQGDLHEEMRNPPTFALNALEPSVLRVYVRAVSMGGAKLEWSVDSGEAEVIELPDRDGSNDGSLSEYGEVFEFTIPAGRHRASLSNTGADWCTIDWYEFPGEFGESEGE